MKWKLLRHPDTMSKDSTVNGNGYFKGFHQPTILQITLKIVMLKFVIFKLLS